MKYLCYLLLALSCVSAVWNFERDNAIPEQCVDPTFACQDLESARLCGVVKSCIHDVWSGMSAPEDNDQICDICKEMVKEARDQLLSNMTQEEIKEVFEGSCKLLPTKLVSDACIKLVDEFIPELVEMLASRMDPTMVCTVSGLCNLVHLPITNVKKESKIQDELVCEFCTHVLQHIKDLVTANTTVEEFRTALLNFCKQTGKYSSKCTDLVNEYYDEIFAYIRNLNTKGFCTLITLCDGSGGVGGFIKATKLIPATRLKSVPMVKLVPAKRIQQSNDVSQQPQQLPVERISHPVLSFERDAECAFCRAISFYFQHDVGNTRRPGVVQKELQEVCGRWVTEYTEQCDMFISKYGQRMKHRIMKGVKYEDLCLSMKVCPLEDGKGNELNVKVVPPPKQSNVLCDVCKETFDELETYLKDPSTKATIQKYLDNFCNYMPKSMQGECKDAVNQNINTLLNILEQELTGDNVCPALRLCPKSGLKPKTVKSIECDVCKDFVEQLQNRLQDPDTKKSLQDLLNRACAVLPTEIANECKVFVQQNLDNLINVLVQDLDPTSVCSAFKLCDGTFKIILPKVKSLECDLCKEVVQQVDDELKDQRTEEEIRDALDKVCSYFPAKMSAKCKNFVDKYSNLLITLLAEEMDPTLVCAALKVCPEKGLECSGCQYLFHYIQNQLMDSSVQDNIKLELERVCDLLPGAYSKNCADYINEFGSSLLVIVAQYLDPSTMCYSYIHACTNGTRPSITTNSLKLDKCSLCTTVVDYMDKLLEEDDVDKEITSLIEKACSVVPASAKEKCSILVETYGPYLLQMIGQLADSKQVCQDIDMCPRSPGHVHLLGGRKCTFGPSYWCKSRAHAVACKAEDYCAKMK